MAFDPSTAKPVSGGFDPSTAVPVADKPDEDVGAIGTAEAAATMLSGAVAEPIAGIAGIASIPFKGSEAGDIVNKVREIFTYQPRTEEGRRALEVVAGALEPVARVLGAAEETMGDAGYDIAGPVGGAIGKTIPSAATELLGAKGLQRAARLGPEASAAFSGDIPAEAADVIASGEAVGVPVMTTDVVQPATFAGKTAQQAGEKVPIAGTGGARQTQQELRQRAVENVADTYGEYDYKTIVESLKAKKDKIKAAAGSVLEATAEKIDDAFQWVAVDRTLDSIDSAREILSKPNVIDNPKPLADLNRVLEAIKQPQTFTTLKENRTALRDIIESADPAVRSQLGTRGKSQLQAVYKAMTDDMEEAARQSLSPADFAKWKKANAVYADEARTLTRSKIKNILDKGDVTPESVTTMLFSRNPSEQKLLYDSLGQAGRSNARAAIVSRIVDDVSKRRSGLTPNAFLSEAKKHQKAIDIFFKGEEKARLNGLLKVLEATYRAQEAGVSTPTGQQLIPILTGAAAVANLGATVGVGGTIGGLARLYESAPVRNALLRLSSAPPGSMTYAQALLSAQLALTAARESGAAEQETQQEQSQP